MNYVGSTVVDLAIARVESKDGELPYLSIFSDAVGQPRIEVARVLDVRGQRDCRKLANLMMASPRLYEALLSAKEALQRNGMSRVDPVMVGIDRAIQTALGNLTSVKAAGS